MEVENKEKKKIAAYIFVGCICLGAGIGLYFGKPAPGALVGVGVGFLVRALYNSRNNP